MKQVHAHKPVGAIAWTDADQPKRKRGNSGGSSESDFSIASEFAETNGDRFRYDASAAQWFEFNGVLWRPDETDRASAAMLVILQRHGIGSAKKLRDAMKLAAIDARLVVTREAWDQNPYLLGTPRAVFDLRTGKALPPDPRHMVSMSAAVSPSNEAPGAWRKFIAEVTRGDPAYERYLQQVCGHSLSGLINEEKFWFIYGDGGGGKGTFLDTYAACLGEYGWKAAARTFLASKNERHLTEIASLHRKRFAYISETPADADWDIARLKELTGGDPINANRMRQDPFTFLPTHKLLAMGNHAPTMPQIDNSIRRRLRILPFDNIVPDVKRDVTLKERLKAELPGIMAWAIEGFLDWQKHGFIEPKAVVDAGEVYFNDHDAFGEWMAEKCSREDRHEENSSILIRSWNAFLKDRGEPIERPARFAERMRRAGFYKIKKSEIFWRGITLKTAGEF